MRVCAPVLQIDRTFGFETAVEEAQRALLAAKVEASSAHRGLGLVKLMGRQSGFIAVQASMASGETRPRVKRGLGGRHPMHAESRALSTTL